MRKAGEHSGGEPVGGDRCKTHVSDTPADPDVRWRSIGAGCWRGHLKPHRRSRAVKNELVRQELLNDLDAYLKRGVPAQPLRWDVETPAVAGRWPVDVVVEGEKPVAAWNWLWAMPAPAGGKAGLW